MFCIAFDPARKVYFRGCQIRVKPHLFVDRTSYDQSSGQSSRIALIVCLSASTQIDYRTDVDAKVLPFVGGKIRRLFIERFQKWLFGTGDFPFRKLPAV